jgi:GTP:adenosylcobinamide-phosphate guanylyltransferase/aminoglycoside phosphotransferase
MNTQTLHVVVQAGGRGSRLRHHTWNKPKCLVSVQGKPLLYRLFERFPQARFHIIGDYAFDRLKTYLEVNPPGVDYRLLQTTEKGTASGIDIALQQVPADAPLLLTWSDLIIGDLPAWPEAEVPVVCTTSAFTCRWSVTDEGSLKEIASDTTGIPGLFYFKRASLLPAPRPGGEFVKWFSENVHEYVTLACPDMQELGDFAVLEQSNDRAGFCRFFNRVEVGTERVVKTAVDPLYHELHRREIAWYREAQRLGFRRIPRLFSEAPLTMERIPGQHAYQMSDLTERERRAVLADHLDALIALHDTAEAPASDEAMRDVYLHKTVDRVTSVSSLIPGFDQPSTTINGKKCRNPFAEKHRGILDSLMPMLQVQRFVPIHGDATFSNTLVDDKLRVWFIDPRGYFAKPGIMGDAWYDFAKVYYSAVGGYDIFNRRKFKLHIDNETVEVLMEPSSFARTGQSIFADYFGREQWRIEIIHALIWLAFAGYVKDDIDSVIGAFYLGLYWLETGMARL